MFVCFVLRVEPKSPCLASILCVSVHAHVHIRTEARKAVSSLRTGVTGFRRMPVLLYGRWTPYSGPHDCTADPSLQPSGLVFNILGLSCMRAFPAGCLGWDLYCCAKNHNQKHLGEKRSFLFELMVPMVPHQSASSQ